MLAAFKQGNDVTLSETRCPDLKPGQIRARVDACGICGTDIHSQPTDEKEPFGHEVAGTVLECGLGVEHLHVGQRVVLDSATPCGRCDACKNGQQELCTDIQSFWFIPSFGFAEEMVAPAICAIPCDDLSPEVACLQEPLGVALDLARLTEITPDSNVLVMGQGPIGLMATALARRSGARRVFATELKERRNRVELSRAFGAHACFDPQAVPLDTFDFGCHIDRIMVTAPPQTLPSAIAVAAKGGLISFIGIGFDESAKITFDADAFHFKKLQLRASFASPALFGPQALRLLREDEVDGAALITHQFPLKEMKQAMDVARNDMNAVKVVVRP